MPGALHRRGTLGTSIVKLPSLAHRCKAAGGWLCSLGRLDGTSVAIDAMCTFHPAHPVETLCIVLWCLLHAALSV